MNHREIFAKRLRQARVAAGYNQAQLAKKINVVRNTYFYYETSHNEPSLETLCELARILNVTPNWLLGFEE